MKKFWVIFFSILVVCTVGVSMIFVLSTRETIKISADVMYVNIGEEFELTLNQTNADSSTTITASSSDSSIVSWNNGLCVAKAGGVARITFTTSNARYRNLYCDVMVGDGSKENPYYVSTAEQFAQIASNENNLCYKLVSDIDLADYNNGYWTPIANFNGRLDGNGYTIKNLYINQEENAGVNNSGNIGLFETIEADAYVYNVKIEACNIIGDFTNVGTIAGINYGTIERVEIKDTFLDVNADFVGGVVGINMTVDNNVTDVRYNAVISKTSANVILGQSKEMNKNEIVYTNTGITGTIGGIAGQNMGGTISNSYSVGKVVLGEAGIVYGGIVGDNQYTTVSNINPATNSYVSAGKIENSYSAIALFSNKVNNYSNENIGGVVGVNNDIVEEIDNNGVAINYNSNNLSGLYYDKDKLNYSSTSTIKVFDGIGKNLLTSDTVEVVNTAEKSGYVFGYNTNSMKIISNYKTNSKVTEIYNTSGTLLTTKTETSNWDFTNVWLLDSASNNGYPTLTYIYIENTEDATTDRSYVILDTYQFTITQASVDTNNAVAKVCNFVIKDGNGNVVKESDSTIITIPLAEGYKVGTTTTGLVITDLNGDVYYSIAFEIKDADYKFSSITLDNYTAANNGSIKTDGEAYVWFRNTSHTLTFINANTGKTIKTYTVTEGTRLQEYIEEIEDKYDSYSYVKFSTNSNGSGLYSASSKMPSKDLTLYVNYGNTSIGNNNSNNNSNDEIGEYNPDIDDNDDNNDKDYNEDSDTYEIANEDDWNDYVTRYADDEDVTFEQTASFTITTSFEAVESLAGTYNGNGYTITVRGKLSNFALFDEIEEDGSVTELKVKYTSVTFKSLLNDDYFGAIANTCSGTIEECSVSGTINYDDTVKKAVGGIVGHLIAGSVIDCTNSAKISFPSQSVAGIVGSMKKGTVEDCSNSGAITNESDSISSYTTLKDGTVMTAGIVGYMYNKTTKKVIDNTNSGKIVSAVSGNNDGGNSAGIVGYLVYGTVSGNKNTGDVESDYQAGGIVAFMCGGTVSDNTNTGDIIAESEEKNTNTCAGGIVGKIKDSGTVKDNSHSQGEIVANSNKSSTTEAYAGGIVGGMFYGGSVTGNSLDSNCQISATGKYCYAAGGVGVVDDASYGDTSYTSSWKRNCEDYLDCTGENPHINYDANER